MATLTAPSAFCQHTDTTQVWKENRNGKVVVVMTEKKSLEIADKLIDRKELQDSTRALNAKIAYQDSLIANYKRENIILNEEITQCDRTNALSEKQISNHIKIESNLNAIIEQQKKTARRNILIGTASGIIGGIVFGILIKQ